MSSCAFSCDALLVGLHFPHKLFVELRGWLQISVFPCSKWLPQRYIFTLHIYSGLTRAHALHMASSTLLYPEDACELTYGIFPWYMEPLGCLRREF